MTDEEYRDIKQRAISYCGHSRTWKEYQELEKRIYAECTPQQKGAYSKAIRQRFEDLEYTDMY